MKAMSRTHLGRLLTIGALVTAFISGCAPATTPPPTAAPAKPAEKTTAAPTEARQAKAAEPAAAKPPTTAPEVFAYSGPDRQQLLEAGASKDPKILWYTSLIVQDRARPLADAFRKKYPQITMDIVRADGAETLTRVIEEYRAGRHEVDIFEQSFPATSGLKEAQILTKFSSPALESLPKEASDPDGYFFPDRENPLIVMYNTKLVSEAEAPKTFDDLLNPKLKGKLATQDSSQAVQYTGAMLRLKGEDFVRRLSEQDVQVFSGAARQVADLVAAGEVPVMFPASISHAQILQKEGAPVNWTPLEQSPTATGYVSLPVRAPRPHAAALFADFLLSTPGQEVMVQTEMGSVLKAVKNPYPDFKKVYIDFLMPQNQYNAEYKKWAEMHNALFVKRRP
jgi:iron(III) transport system substrate-binding protein